MQMLLRTSVFAFTALAVASTAMADFSGYYDPFNWELDSSRNGFVDITGGARVDHRRRAGCRLGRFWLNHFFIDVPSNGTFSFDWVYTTDDADGWDAGLYINNGWFFLSDADGEFRISLITGWHG